MLPLLLSLVSAVSLAVIAPATRSDDADPAEVARVQAHFAAALAEVRAHETRALTREQERRRTALLDEVERYASRGVFPHNHERKETVPVFIDEHGNPCAVAQMMIASGELALAQSIARDDVTVDLPIDATHAYGARVAFFALKNGFTVDELARIQPSYGPMVTQGTRLCHRALGDDVDELRARFGIPERTGPERQVALGPIGVSDAATAMACVASLGSVADLQRVARSIDGELAPPSDKDGLLTDPSKGADWAEIVKHGSIWDFRDVVSAAACGKGKLDAVSFVLDKGFVPEQGTLRGRDAVYCAARAKDYALLERLVAANAPRERAFAAVGADVTLLKWLLAHGFDANAKAPVDSWQPSSSRFVVVFLAPLARSDEEEDWTPLHYAALFGNADVARELIAHHARIDSTSKSGVTPAMLAAYAANEEVLALLLKAGASRTRKSKTGYDIAGAAVESTRIRGKTPSERRAFFLEQWEQMLQRMEAPR